MPTETPDPSIAAHDKASEQRSPDLEKAESTSEEEHEPVEDDVSSGYIDEAVAGRPSWELHPTRTPPRSLKVRQSQSAMSQRRSALHRTHSSALSIVRSRGPENDEVRRRFTHKLEHVPTGPDVVVDFDGPKDPYKAINWPFKKKVITIALYGLTTAGSTFASSVFSTGLTQVEREFHVGDEVGELGISLLLVGFGLGPLLWAPLSEVYGRKHAVLIPYFLASIFSFATAVAKDIQTVMITRFFTGFFGSAPITNTGGVLGDLFSPQQRGVAMVGYAMAVVGGPTLGPLVGSAVVTTRSLGWRWTEYITGIFMLAILALDVLILDESYSGTLLVHKARRLRVETGNWALHAKHEEWDVSVVDLAKKYLVRPFQMLATPICFLMATYASFVYGILYANLSVFPTVFEGVRGWGPVTGSLSFIAMLIGIFIAGGLNVFNQKYYFAKFKANGNRAVPEARLPPMMFGSVIMVAGMFLFCWTAEPKFHWIAPMIGCVMIGCGFFTIFQAALNYLVDTFQMYAASAVAANTFLRSVFAAAFPLFINQEIRALGVGWGVSVFAFFAMALIPIPYLFFIYGKRIRARGYWSRASL